MQIHKWVRKHGYGNDTNTGNGKDKRATSGRIRARMKSIFRKLGI